jgi:L-rhamnose mutarotase
MKKWIFCLPAAFLGACILFAWNGPAAAEPDDLQDFRGALEEHMQNTVHYYHEESAEIKDFIAIDGEVVKIIQTDDSSTPANEEKIEEYSSRIAVAFTEYELQRDSIFFFKKRDMYYYDLENKTFLSSVNVMGNTEVEQLFRQNMHDFTKQLTTASLITLLFILSTIIIVPVLIMIFHNKSRSGHQPASQA